MKLIIQIPCFNEETTLEQTLQDLPKTIPGIDCLEVLVINDGSTDRTAEVAEAWGVDHLLHFSGNRGLAAAFRAGIEAALAAGADIIVNTDADNQYRGADIAELVRPILDRQADVVIGDRGVESTPHFSSWKRRLQQLGSRLVSLASGLHIPDATSGFRAFSRQAALRLIVLGHYSYTLETLMQAGEQRLMVRYVPIRTAKQTRCSRLMKSVPSFLWQSVVSILRFFLMYRPIRIFMTLGTIFVLAGVLLGLRFLYYYLSAGGAGHMQSLILSAILVIVGFQTGLFGMIADLVRLNRKMLEEVLFTVRRIELERPTYGSHEEKPADVAGQQNPHRGI